MRVHGSVNDAVKNRPLSDARVVLAVGDRELAVLFSDSEGRFEHGEETDYGGQTLRCRVEKEEFEPQEVTYKIEQDELSLEIELVPEEKKIELKSSGLRFDKLWWWVGGLIALEAIVVGFFTKMYHEISLNSIVLIPLATLTLAFFRPINWVYAAFYVIVLHGISFLGFVMAGGSILYHWLNFALVCAGNTVLCAIISFVRFGRLRRK